MKIGIDLGGSHIAIGVVDDNGKILEKIEKRLTDIEKDDIKKSIEDYIIENFNILKDRYRLEEIGIAIPGTVNTNVIIKSVNLDLYDYNIVDSLKKNIDLPIKIRNDAKCAAIAESKYGSLKEYNRTLFLTLGTGIGTAVMIDGKLLNTGDLPGCEAGHMIIEKDGLLCNCGKKGCFEQYASMKAFKNNLRKKLPYEEYQTGEMLERILREKTDDEDLNMKIDNVVDNYIDYLAIGISNLINIFEPEVIGIGGSFVYFKDILLEKLKEAIINKNLLFNSRDEIKIETAILGNDAGIIGAVN